MGWPLGAKTGGGSFMYHLEDNLVSIGFVAGLKGFTAAVIGGIGSIPGAMAGGLILALGAYFARFVGNAVIAYCKNIGIPDAGLLAFRRRPFRRDLVVLSGDIMTCPEKDLEKLQALTTPSGELRPIETVKGWGAASEQGMGHHGTPVTVLRAGAAARFLARWEGADPSAAQQLMARVTGNFKRGNERSGRHRL